MVSERNFCFIVSIHLSFNLLLALDKIYFFFCRCHFTWSWWLVNAVSWPPRHWLHLHTCSAAWQLWVPSTPATSQIFCENSIICGGFPIQPWSLSEITLNHDRQSLSKPPGVTSGPRAKKWINQIHQLSCDKQGSREPTQRATGVHQQRGATEPPIQQGGSVQPLLICFGSRQPEQGSILRLHRVWTVQGPCRQG